METIQKQCPQCGRQLPADAPRGMCAQCLMQVALGDDSAEHTSPVDALREFVPPSPEKLAASFPQLEILEYLGHGGMGAVSRARQKTLDRIVALKILPPQSAGDPAFTDRFSREAKAMARLLHPNIVTVFEFGQADGLCYLIMEYVGGVNLRQAIRARQITAAQALAIVPQICEALEYAHEEGVVHRDIKPENILLDKRGRVKIADFGLAKLVRRGAADVTLTGTQQVVGTFNYMAPEQIERPLDVDHRADIYSLGVVFYELLTGDLPVGRYKLPSEFAAVDQRLDHVVLKTLERQPDARYQRASDLKTDVQAIAAAPVAAPAPVAPAAIKASPAWDEDEQQYAAEQLRGPGVALAIIGLISLSLPFAIPGVTAIAEGGRLIISPHDDFSLLVRLPGALFTWGPGAASGLLMLLGGISMIRGGSQELATIAKFAAIFHLSPLILVSLPFGIWAHMIMVKPEVQKAGFGRRRFRRTDSSLHLSGVRKLDKFELELVRNRISAPATGLIIVGILNMLVLLIPLGMFAYLMIGVSSVETRPATMSGAMVLPPLLLAQGEASPRQADMVEDSSDASPPFPPSGETPLGMLSIALVLGLVLLVSSLVVGSVLLNAGRRMRNLQSQGLAATASLLAILPIHFGWPLGLPMGIWSLVTLARTDVQAAFAMSAQLEDSGWSSANVGPWN
jgi:hypothetical protein